MNLRELMQRSLWPISPFARFEGEGEGDGGGGGKVTHLVDASGNFAPDWQSHLDEDLRDVVSLKEVGDLNQLAKQYIHAQRMVGKDKVPLPGDNASDADWNEFYTKIGRPSTADDYPYVRPETLPEELRSDDYIKDVRQRAYALGLSNKQFAAMMADEDTRTVDKLETDGINARTELEDADKILKEVFGMAYEERINIANLFINETVPEDAEARPNKLFPTREEFIKEFGRNPRFIAWAAEVGKELAEHKVLVAQLSEKAPKEAQAELDEMMASEDWTKFLRGDLARTNQSKHAAMQKKYEELHNLIYPPEKQAG